MSLIVRRAENLDALRDLAEVRKVVRCESGSTWVCCAGEYAGQHMKLDCFVSTPDPDNNGEIVHMAQLFTIGGQLRRIERQEFFALWWPVGRGRL